ncbi:M28 family peptidase [Sandarakinorhabdus sp.]|uniref:M28 family peptidase n=1 Tax=Sandarakinorhabdus sp. TaxID=1916663 RepID=UPI00286E2FF6|nr:M28 family peptidase [Sandarakinorhabdus sp.]
MRAALLAFCLTFAAPALAGPDAETRAWLSLARTLSDDSMEGRDSGSPGHARASALVAQRLEKAGLKPAGDNGSFLQAVPMHDVTVTAAEFEVREPDGSAVPLRFLHDISVRAASGLPAALDLPMRFAGYCSAAELGVAMAGKAAICFGTRRAGLPGAAARLAAVTASGAAAMITVDDPGFNLEPPTWPLAYARTVTLAGSPHPSGLPQFRLNPASLASLIAGSGRLAAAILTDGGLKRPLDNFDVPARFSARLSISSRDFASEQVLALLPGTNPALKDQMVVISAHIDGFGRGEAVAGDAIYNGMFDDAAYVALIVRIAEQRRGKGFARPLLVAAFTGEEKGLLGARWFLEHPNVPRASIAAVLNLDQLRPLFPLKALTMHGLSNTSLGAIAAAVTKPMKIALRPDKEPERALNTRADHWPFLSTGIPASNFLFAYDSGSLEEKLARDWAVRRYHRPQDGPDQPFDMDGARDFNRFFTAYVAAVANAPERPKMLK